MMAEQSSESLAEKREALIVHTASSMLFGFMGLSKIATVTNETSGQRDIVTSALQYLKEKNLIEPNSFDEEYWRLTEEGKKLLAEQYYKMGVDDIDSARKRYKEAGKFFSEEEWESKRKEGYQEFLNNLGIKKTP